MRVPVTAMRHWLARTPLWSAVLLGALIALDAAGFIYRLRVEARTDTHPRQRGSQAVPSLARLDAQQIAAAHLFGVDPAATRPDSAPETELQLALSGVIATRDPNEGYAILGEQGHATRLYHTGAELVSAGAGTLYQVFTDHVVLDFGGRRRTLSLPRRHLDTSAAVRVAHFDTPAAGAAQAAGAAEFPKLISQREDAPSEAESWFSNLNAQAAAADGRTELRLHPAKHFQRRYGFREGDTLTAVDGIPVADEDALNNLLRGGGKTVALTLTRDGVEEIRRFRVDE